MYKVALINMPFAALPLPSIGLLQLRSVVERELGGQVQVEVLHLNQDFAAWFGLDLYQLVSASMEAMMADLGDWLFRDLAFPGLADNAQAYAQRFLRQFQPAHLPLLQRIMERRSGLGACLDQLIDRYDLAGRDLVGFTSMFMQNVPSFAMARRLKQRRPDLVTTIGGANCETTMGEVIARRVDAIDFAFSGPALVSFPCFVGHLAAGRPDSCHQVPGVLSRRKLDGRAAGAPPEMGADLDIAVEVPIDYSPFLDALEQKLPAAGVRPVLLFETSRGCWWGERAHCTFCGLNGLGMAYRAMPADTARAQLEGLFRHAPRVRRFESVDNIMPRSYLTDLFPRLATPPGVEIFYEVKADLKDHEMAVLARAGVTGVQPGIEALSSSTLKLMRKGTTAFQNLRFLKGCLVHGIQPAWNLLIGFPGEDEEVYRKYVDDLPRLVHLPPPTGVYPIRFDRFSPYFKDAATWGLNLAPLDFYAMVYPFDDAELHDLAYFFADRNYAARYLELTARWIYRLRDRIAAWRERWAAGDPPQLALRETAQGALVADSRGGDGPPVLHALQPDALAVVRQLPSALKTATLAERLPELGAARLTEILAELSERGLLFEENGLLMSLILDPAAGAQRHRAAPAAARQLAAM